MVKGTKHSEATKAQIARKVSAHTGWNHTKATKKRIGAASKRNWDNPEYREKMQKILQESWGGNVKRKRQTSRNIRLAMRLRGGSPMKGKRHSVETKEKTRSAQLGKPKSPEHCKAMSEANRARAKGWSRREASVERAVVNWWRGRGFISFKIDPRHYTGAPDRLFLVPGGCPVFVEFKRPDGRGTISKIQARVAAQLKQQGYEVIVSDSRESTVLHLLARCNENA